jgi:hypothetical protein
MNSREFADLWHLLVTKHLCGKPRTVTVINETFDYGEVSLHLLEFPDLLLIPNADEYAYYQYVGPILRLYPGADDYDEVEIY